MKELVQISGMHAIAALLSLAVSSGVWAQQRLDVTPTVFRIHARLSEIAMNPQEYLAQTEVPAPPAAPPSGYVPPAGLLFEAAAIHDYPRPRRWPPRTTRTSSTDLPGSRISRGCSRATSRIRNTSGTVSFASTESTISIPWKAPMTL